jgi:hypothetical protein
VSKKKEDPKFVIAVFDDGKILIVSDTTLNPDQTERLGEQMRKWYDSKIPAAMCIMNATIIHIPTTAGGDEKVLGIAYPPKDDGMDVPKQKKPRADTTGMN